jgi:2-iminobutanoate/2-iminopropanoate deaminase
VAIRIWGKLKLKVPIPAGTTKLPFSLAIQSHNYLFVSGQASVNLSTGEIIPGTLAEEMERSINNLRHIVESAGANWKDIVKVTSYVRRDSDLEEYNRLFVDYFSEPYPARTTITNCLPPTVLFEIDCIAYLSSDK